MVKLSPNNFKCADTSDGPIPVTRYGPGATVGLNLLLLLCFGFPLLLQLPPLAVILVSLRSATLLVPFGVLGIVSRSSFSFFAGRPTLLWLLVAVLLLFFSSGFCFRGRPGRRRPGRPGIAVLFKNFDVVCMVAAPFKPFPVDIANALAVTLPTVPLPFLRTANRLALRRQLTLSELGILAHISLRRRDCVAKSKFWFEFSISWRFSRAQSIYDVNRGLPLSFRCSRPNTTLPSFSIFLRDVFSVM